MQVNVIRGGDAAFNALLYPPPDQKFLNYLQTNIQSAKESFTGLGTQFVNTVQNMYNKYNSTEAINASKALLQSTGTHFNQHVIYPVGYDNFNTANLMMQRYVMSQPSISEMYRDNMCHGYQETYFDPEPNTYGEDRTDYRRVMDGVLQYDEEDAYFNYYSQDSEEDDLDDMDKLSILDTWDNALRLINEGVDPTSPDLDDL